jgi:1,2-phenylacetyl-CoA epoxidase catalytic subunit
VAIPDWVPIVGVVGAALAAIIPAFRIRSDARKARQDGTAALMTSAGAMVTAMEGDLKELRHEVAEFRQWRNRKDARDRLHSRWDDQVVSKLSAAGITVPEPPPLFDTNE